MEDIKKVTVKVIDTDMSRTILEKFGVCGNVVEKKAIMGISKMRYSNVIFRFRYNGYNQDALEHINLFAYALEYSGNIDEDINCIEEESFAYEYPETIYTLLFKSKDGKDDIILRSDPSSRQIIVDIVSEKIRENPNFYDDCIINAYAQHCGMNKSRR